MTLADQIREYVAKHYIQPARQKGEKRVTVRVGDVHEALGLSSRLPAVCGALSTLKFEKDQNLRLVSRRGPDTGANTVFIFEILGKS